jgi:hypothetical protein
MPAEFFQLTGQPKSGTTWLEVVLITLIRLSCTDECASHYDSAGRQLRINVASAPDMNVAARNVTVELARNKHYLQGFVRTGRRRDNVKLRNSAVTLLRKCSVAGVSLWSNDCLRHLGRPARVSPHTRFILLLRDPRATMVSWLRFIGGNITNATKVLHDVQTEGAATTLRFVVHTRFLSAQTLTLYYEDLLTDTSHSFYTIASYLGFSPSHAQMSAVINRTTPKALRTMEAAHALPGRYGNKVRSASANGFERELGTHMLQMMNARLVRILVPALLTKWRIGATSEHEHHES